MKRFKEWLRLQCAKQPVPYSLCQKPIEALPVWRALRAQAEQQALHQDLGLELTAQGIVVPAPPA